MTTRDRQFWIDPNQWPREPSGYVFLARAFDMIGRAMFGPNWTGEECLAGQPRLLTSPQSPDAMAVHKTALAAYEKKKTVQNEIAMRCESRQINSAFRYVEGGEMLDINPICWNTDNLDPRFALCQLDPRNPFGSAISGDHFGWIFLEREDLERFLLSQPFAEKPSGLDFHLSPYMQTLVTVARKMKITPENQPKIAEIEAELEAAWTGPDPLGTTIRGYMATILREPESRAGRGRSKKD